MKEEKSNNSLFQCNSNSHLLETEFRTEITKKEGRGWVINEETTKDSVNVFFFKNNNSTYRLSSLLVFPVMGCKSSLNRDLYLSRLNLWYGILDYLVRISVIRNKVLFDIFLYSSIFMRITNAQE